MVLTTLTAIGSMLRARSGFVAAPLLCLFVGTCYTILVHGSVWTQLSPDRMLPYPDGGLSIDRVADVSEYVARYAAYRGQALILDDEIAVRVGDPAVYDWFGLSYLFSTGHVRFEVWSCCA